ncbi:MAG: PH domain-containing protein [Proteobacteria bacterium]|nr:PH domain-containing protein [Pseudomonadota bacterium]
MSYVNSVLQPGETIRAIGKLHWIIFLRAFVLMIVGIILFIYSSALSLQLGQLVQLGGWLLLALSVLAFLHAWFVRWITELAITDRRVIYKHGFLSRRTVEMNMGKVEIVDVEQSILGRLLGFGTIRVRGTGQGIENLTQVAAPLELRNAITAR